MAIEIGHVERFRALSKTNLSQQTNKKQTGKKGTVLGPLQLDSASCAAVVSAMAHKLKLVVQPACYPWSFQSCQPSRPYFAASGLDSCSAGPDSVPVSGSDLVLAPVSSPDSCTILISWPDPA